jgi:hypothetical protein
MCDTDADETSWDAGISASRSVAADTRACPLCSATFPKSAAWAHFEVCRVQVREDQATVWLTARGWRKQASEAEGLLWYQPGSGTGFSLKEALVVEYVRAVYREQEDG